MNVDYGDSFFTEVTEDNILHTSVGNLDSEKGIENLKKIVVDTEHIVRDMHQKNGKKVLSLIDISHLKKYSPVAFEVVRKALQTNDAHVRKTATYGGAPFILLAQEAVSAMAGIPNFEAFKTKEDAVKWLKS